MKDPTGTPCCSWGGVIPLIHTWHHPRRCISVITDIFQLELSINLL